MDILSAGSNLEASAHPFAEFSLCSGQDELLRLRYLFEIEVEKLGGIVYQSEYLGRHWTLQFFRTPYLQRESYRVLCDGIVIVKTDVLRMLRSAEVCFPNGSIWHCHVGILGLEVKDTEGNRMLHTTPRPGMSLGGSSIHIDKAIELGRAMPLLIILMHATTHSSG